VQKRRPRVSCAAAGAAPVFVLFDLDTVVAGLDVILTTCAFDAAKAQWGPATVVGSAAAYVPTMRRLLNCTEAPEEAALLIRLCADEGIIGGGGVGVNGPAGAAVRGCPESQRSRTAE
jgi:hypothetical protein